MKYGTVADRFLRPRWAGWLSTTLDRSGLTARNLGDLLRSDEHDRDTAKRSAVRAWLRGERTISPERAFDVGNILRENGHVSRIDGIVALHAAGYFAQAIACLETIIAHALVDYEIRVPAGGIPIPYSQHGADRRIEYALRCAAGLPVAHADLDGIKDSLISPSYRETVGNSVTDLSDVDTCKIAWQGHDTEMSRWADLITWSRRQSADLSGSSILAWAAFIDSISTRALHDERLAYHWTAKRRWLSDYRNAAFGGVPIYSTFS